MEDFAMEKAKVYIKTDEKGRICRCEGGYTMGNIEDVTEWLYIDAGEGDKYNLCQCCYFTGGLFTEDGIPRWKYENGQAALRTDAEIEADRAELPEPEPPYKEIWDALDEAYLKGYQEGVDSV